MFKDWSKKLMAATNWIVPTRRTAAHQEYPIGAGFYAFRTNESASGRQYTKLVKRDRSREPLIKPRLEPVHKQSRIRKQAAAERKRLRRAIMVANKKGLLNDPRI